jgi:hypothetical protein
MQPIIEANSTHSVIKHLQSTLKVSHQFYTKKSMYTFMDLILYTFHVMSNMIRIIPTCCNVI